MKEMVRDGALDSMLSRRQRRMVLDFSLDEFKCDACHKSKDRLIKEKKSKHRLTRDNEPGDVVVSDCSGPFANGEYYILVYDLATKLTQVTWVNSLTGERTLEVVERFFESVYNLYGRYPFVFRADRGSNYTSRVFIAAIQEYGTQIQFADPGAHWQNGFAEKRIDTIEVRALAILEVSGLPMSFFYMPYSTLFVWTTVSLPPVASLPLSPSTDLPSRRRPPSLLLLLGAEH